MYKTTSFLTYADKFKQEIEGEKKDAEKMLAELIPQFEEAIAKEYAKGGDRWEHEFRYLHANVDYGDGDRDVARKNRVIRRCAEMFVAMLQQDRVFHQSRIEDTCHCVTVHIYQLQEAGDRLTWNITRRF